MSSALATPMSAMMPITGGGANATPGDTAASTDSVLHDGVELEAHEYASIFPELSSDRLAELTQDIREHGLLEKVMLFEGKVLDGRGRYRGCRVAGVEPEYDIFIGTSTKAIEYVASRNQHRRHLTDSQRAIAAAKIATFKLGANQHSEGLSIGRASKLMNVSDSSVARGRVVLEEGDQELVEAVESGELSVSAAAAQARDQAAPLHSVPETAPTATDNVDTPPAAEPSSDTDTTDEPHTKTVESPTLAEPPVEEFTCPPSFTIPTPGITIIVGDAKAAVIEVAIKIGGTITAGDYWPDNRRAERGSVIWLSCRPKARTSLHTQFEAAEAHPGSVHIVGPKLDDFGLPILHLSHDLRRLDEEINKVGPVSCVIVDHFSEYLRSDDIEKSIRSFQRAIDALHEFAGKHGAAVILTCQLPTNNQDAVAQALAAVGSLEAVNAVLLVERDTKPNRGAVTPVKDKVNSDVSGFSFQLRNRNSVPAVAWDAVRNDLGKEIEQ